VARDVLIPSVEQEDAKRIERERKHLVEARISIVGRIKGLLALHGIWLTGKRIGKGLRDRLDTIRTGDGRPLAPFLRRDIERMCQRRSKNASAGRSKNTSAMLARRPRNWGPFPSGIKPLWDYPPRYRSWRDVSVACFD